MRNFKVSALTLPLALLLLSATSGGPLQAQELWDRFRVVAEGYEENRWAFIHGKCRFTYSMRTAENEEAALNGEWNDAREHAVVEYELFWKPSQFVVRVDLDTVEEGFEDAEVFLTPINIAEKDGFAIDHDPIVNTAIVHSPANYNLSVRMHPFNLAMDSEVNDLYLIFETAKSRHFSEIQLEINESVESHGRVYTQMKQGHELNSHDKVVYIDPDRGYLPFITEYYHKQVHSGELWARIVLLDVHQEGGAYFPMHAVVAIPREPPDGPSFIDAREMKVVELDLSYHPTAEDLTIYLPKSAQYYDGVNPNTAKTLYRDQDEDFAAVSVNDIEPIYNQLQALAKEREAAEVALAERRDVGTVREGPKTYYVLAVVNVLVVAALIAIYVIRRRRRTPDAT